MGRGDRNVFGAVYPSQLNEAAMTSHIAETTTAHGGIEPTIPAGTTSQYYRGDKTWQDLTSSVVDFNGLPIYANNAAAITGGLTAGKLYRTGTDPDHLCIVH